MKNGTLWYGMIRSWFGMIILRKVMGRSGLTLPIVWGSISLSKVSLWYYRDGIKKRICDQHKADL